MIFPPINPITQLNKQFLTKIGGVQKIVSRSQKFGLVGADGQF